MELSNYDKSLPLWLDALIYDQVGASYNPRREVFVAEELDRDQTLEYLGTYFPRSYSESFCIFRDFFVQHAVEWSAKSEIAVLDLGCGCGGELVGMLDAMKESLDSLPKIKVVGVDGNRYGLELCEKVMEAYRNVVMVDVTFEHKRWRFSDLDQVQRGFNLTFPHYDVVLSFKVMNEVVSRGLWGCVNVYKEFLKLAKSILRDGGVVCMADIDMSISIMDRRDSDWGTEGLINGVCSVREAAEYIKQESGNTWACIEGECPDALGMRPCQDEKSMMNSSRRCTLSLCRAYYRDLMWQSVFGHSIVSGYNPIMHNLDAHASNRAGEKNFVVRHSRSINGDREGLFWVLLSKIPQMRDEDLSD